MRRFFPFLGGLLSAALLADAFRLPAPLNVIQGFVAGFGCGWLFVTVLLKRKRV